MAKKETVRASYCGDFTDSEGKPLEAGEWYWTTHPAEGDVWCPINVQEVYYVLNGEHRYTFNDLDGLVVKRAIMPL